MGWFLDRARTLYEWRCAEPVGALVEIFARGLN